MKSYSIRIEHRCPQCGAPAILEETDRLFSCSFCRVRSYLTVRDYFRYLLPFNTPETDSLFFFPYWRFKGMIFSQVMEGIRHQVVDVSHQAVDLQFVPPSLGFRSQALKLKFVSSETEGFFLKPERSADMIREHITDFIGLPLPKPVFYQTHIGESFSLIYAPFYTRNGRLFDAILNEPLLHRLPEDFHSMSLAGGPPDSTIRFIPTLCPDCGWDLQGARDSILLHCSNCETVWMPVKNRFKKFKAAHLPGEGAGLLYLPFWRIRAEIQGIELTSYADLVRVANLPKVLRSGWEELPFYFWTPAFKIRPDLFLRLCTSLTLSQPHNDLVQHIPKNKIHSVTLEISEAMESLKLSLTTLVKPRIEFIEKLSDVSVNPKSVILVYLPFQTDRHDYVLSRFSLSINKNALGFASNL